MACYECMKKNETCAERCNELRREIKFLRARIQGIAKEIQDKGAEGCTCDDYAQELFELAKEKA